MPRLNCTFGSFHLRGCRDGLILCGGDAWRDRFPDALEVHLTLLLQGNRSSHVTIKHSNGKSERDDLAEEWFSPPKLRQLFSRMHELLGVQWQRHLRLVDLDELTEHDFVAVPTTDAAVVRHLAPFFKPNGIRVSNRELDRFADATIDLICECAVWPDELPLLLNPTEPIYSFRLADDGSVLQHYWLASADDDVHGRRWFAVDANAFAPFTSGRSLINTSIPALTPSCAESRRISAGHDLVVRACSEADGVAAGAVG